MQIILFNFDAILLLAYNSKLAYPTEPGPTLPGAQRQVSLWGPGWGCPW